jgi:hypothetical protein
MVPTSFAESNTVLDKPDEMTREEYHPIQALVSELPNGFYSFISCWKLTQEEMHELQRNGGRIYIKVFGNQMQPIVLSPIKPF